MNTIVQFPDAEARIRAAIDAGILKRGTWGNGTDAVCMMSAVVSGADGKEACVTAGWPEWLVEVNVSLFDAYVGADDEGAAATTFSLDLFKAAALPFDADKARDRFLIRRLDTGDHSALKSLRLNRVDADWWRDCEAAIVAVVALLHRRIAGEDVATEMKAAADAADAAYAAARAAARAD